MKGEHLHPLGLVSVTAHCAEKNSRNIEGKHSNEAHPFTELKCIVSEDLGLKVPLGSQVLLLHYLVLVYNLAFDEDLYSRSFVNKAFQTVDVSQLLTNTMELIGFKTSRSVVCAGHLTIGGSLKLPQVDRIDVIALPNKHADTSGGLRTVFKLELNHRALTKQDVDAVNRANQDVMAFNYETAFDGSQVARVPARIRGRSARVNHTRDVGRRCTHCRQGSGLLGHCLEAQPL
jgi:hypothetical protein